MICTLCIVSHALPSTIWRPYSSGCLRCAPTVSRRIAIFRCNPAFLLKQQTLDPSDYTLNPPSLLVHPNMVLFRPSIRRSAVAVHDLKPRHHDIFQSRSNVRRSALILEYPDPVRAGPRIEQERIYSHSLCQNHRNLIIHSAVSRALVAQLFRSWVLTSCDVLYS